MERQDLNGKDLANPLTFCNDGQILEAFESELHKKHSWAGKFGLSFNGKFEFFKTFKGIKKRAEKLIDSHQLILE